MNFNLNQALEVLERTPDVLEALLSGLSAKWTENNEGPETWSPFDVVGHLLHGEKTDWIPRLEKTLSAADKNFAPFDRFAQFASSKGKTMEQLLAEFKSERAKNLAVLRSKNLQESDFSKTAIHPVHGTVTMHELLSTWVAHDLNHTAQIARVMAKQYKEDVGPWISFLRIMK